MVMSFSTWMADMDFGEMFHNFCLDPRIRPFAVVSIDRLGMAVERPDAVGNVEKGKVETLQWTRIFMGMKPSLYNAVRHYYLGEEFARGNPTVRDNPMSYDRI